MACELQMALRDKLPNHWRSSSQNSYGSNVLAEVSPERRDLSAQEQPFDLSVPILQYEKRQPTILYLAYGSNLASSVFQGRRAIRPIAAINVLAPELELVFNLPGLPYSEPAFANTQYRQTTEPPLSQASKAPLKPSSPPSYPRHTNSNWSRGLVGVVYEVTLSDYAHIVATEGGGYFYHDVLTTCYPLPSNTRTVPTHPSTKPFKAHTLYNPIYPPGKAPPGLRKPHLGRPDPTYAQPSLRYLDLLRTGAEENGLPDDYREYLRELQSYTITSRGQEVGQFVFMMIWFPFIMLIFALSKRYADEDGKSPRWLSRFSEAVFRGVWANYDGWGYGIFGDGERTQGSDGDEVKGGMA